MLTFLLGGTPLNKFDNYMIPNNPLRINAVVTISQRFLFKEIEVNRLSDIYKQDFFTYEKIESLKENSLSLPSELSINCVEIETDYPIFIQISDNFLNLASVWEMSFNKDANILTIICSDGIVHTLGKEDIKNSFTLDNLKLLPVNLQAHLYNVITETE